MSNHTTPADQAGTSSKKRKSSSKASTSVEVVLHEASASAGPAFANFPSIRPGKDTPFQIYTRDVNAKVDITQQRTILAGETEDVEYFSVNRDSQQGGEAQDCQYLPAIYDPTSNTLTIHPSAPVYLLAHRAKRLRPSPTASLTGGVSAERRAKWREQRNTLGETFGTRKAKSQIKAEERNKVDVGAMEGVRGHLMQSIQPKAAAADVEPPPDHIPTPNLETQDPLQVYPRQSLIPNSDYSSIQVGPILKTKGDEAVFSHFPWRKGSWFSSKVLATIRDTQTNRKQTIIYLYYISALHHLLLLAPRLTKLSSTELNEARRGIPLQLFSSMLERFAEKSGNKYVVTDPMKIRILAWICCLCLMVEGGAVEIAKVAKDLNMAEVKVNSVFKSLGCTVETASVVEREKAGISLAQAQASKKAVLKAPVKFPKAKRRGPVKR